MNKKYTWVLLTLLTLMSVGLSAQNKTSTNERSLPLHVEADHAVYTDVTQTSVFTGRVILTQGSMKIEADHVETIVDPEGFQYATATMDDNSLVHFEQKRQGTDEILKAQGQKLIFDGKQNLVVFSKQAQMRRLTPKGQLIDKLDSDELVYNQLTEVFESRALPNGTGRSRAIITPNAQKK